MAGKDSQDDRTVAARLYDVEGRLLRVVAVYAPPPPSIIMYIQDSLAYGKEECEADPTSKPHILIAEFEFVERFGHICWCEQKRLVRKVEKA